MNTPGDQDHLVEVQIIDLPVALHGQAVEYQADLQREFTLIAQADDPSSVPPRLLGLIRRLNEQFGAFSGAQFQAIDDALARGEESIDITFRVPPEAGPATVALLDMLAEADAYCTAGKNLLTLAAPGHVVRYREWFLGEFVRQTSGEAPRPWTG